MLRLLKRFPLPSRTSMKSPTILLFFGRVFLYKEANDILSLRLSLSFDRSLRLIPIDCPSFSLIIFIFSLLSSFSNYFWPMYWSCRGGTRSEGSKDCLFYLTGRLFKFWEMCFSRFDMLLYFLNCSSYIVFSTLLMRSLTS